MGATITLTSDPDEHDRYMSYVQVLTHFVYMCFARTLQSDDVALSRAWDYQTPPFRYLAGFAGRVMTFDTDAKTELYRDIQLNAQRPEVRASFARNTAALATVFDSHDVQSATDELKRIYTHLTPEDSAVCQALTGSAILAEQADAADLQRHRREAELCGLETENTIRIGTILDLDARSITFEDALVPHQGPGPFGLVHTPTARRAAGELGFGTGKTVVRRLPRQAVRPLTQGETQAWLDANLRHHQRSLTIEAPRQASPDRIAAHLVRMVSDVLACELSDVFLPDHEPDIQRVTYDVALRGCVPADATVRALSASVEDFGLRGPLTR